MDTSVIGKRIRYERKKMNLTLKELGHLLGVTEQCISGWEHSRNIPDIIALCNMAEIFKIEIKDFLSLDFDSNTTCQNTVNLRSLSQDEILLLAKFNNLPQNKKDAINTLFGIKD